MQQYDLCEGAFLSRITRYQLDRPGEGQEEPDKRIFIDVHEIVAGEGKGGFFAIPHLMVGGTKEEYIVVGDSSDMVLSECLKRLKGVDFSQIPER